MTTEHSVQIRKSAHRASRFASWTAAARARLVSLIAGMRPRQRVAPPFPRKALFEALEPRLLLSGDPAPVTQWDGGGDGINWQDALNWDRDLLPTSEYQVVIEGLGPGIVKTGGTDTVAALTSSRALGVTGGSLSISGTSLLDTLTVSGGTVTVGQDAAMTLSNDLTLSGSGSLALGGGAHLTVLDDLTLSGTSVLVGQAKDTQSLVGGVWSDVGVTITAGGDVTIESGSRISADGQGYVGGGYNAAGAGPGGAPETSEHGGGGGYGGAGGRGYNEVGGAAYGSALMPAALGSGGAYGGGAAGGAGGGAIRLSVGDVLTLDGEISRGCWGG